MEIPEASNDSQGRTSTHWPRDGSPDEATLMLSRHRNGIQAASIDGTPNRPSRSSYEVGDDQAGPLPPQRTVSTQMLQDGNAPNTSDGRTKHDGNVQVVFHEKVQGKGHQAHAEARTSWKWLAYTAIIGASALVPVIALIIWLAVKRPGMPRTKFNSFSGETIGGKLTQAQAKAIDVVCSIVVAPVLMAALDYFWLGIARVAVVNEQNRRNDHGVPLTALAAASCSSAGTYSPGRLYPLLRGKTWRLSVLAALLLLSAVTRSALSNILAYEAYPSSVFASKVGSLRSLASRNYRIVSTARGGFGWYEGPYNNTQRVDVVTQLSGLLNEISNQNASSELTAGAYIGANVTTDSLNSLPPDVVGLSDIPGFRMTVGCTADRPAKMSIKSTGSPIDQTWVNFYTSKDPAAMKTMENVYTAEYPGYTAKMTNNQQQLVAFSYDYETVYLAFLDPFNSTAVRRGIVPEASSPYGTIKPTSQNLTQQGNDTLEGHNGLFINNDSVMTYWGIMCSIYRQEGLLTYTRTPANNWIISSMSFQAERRVIPSPLAPWQVSLQYHAQNAIYAGLGPPLAYSAISRTNANLFGGPGGTSYETLAQNYLYAVGETQRIVYEVAATDTSGDVPEDFYDVEGTVSRQYYRMTYVPAILMTGLVSLLLAAGATIGVSYYASGTHSAKTFREVDTMRLVLDALEGLSPRQEGVSERRGAGARVEAFEEITKMCRVEYIKTVEDGEVIIKLRRVDRPNYN
ncbi:hypothetical protein LTS10_006768 [Elasticomyces elasticus]|nr:hypothetical protein LTS10_006768 [Elasticomyces elasticus]